MLQKLSIEWIKLKNYRTFWVLIGLYVVSIAGINLIVYMIQQAIYNSKEGKGTVQMMIGNPPYSFPGTWQATTHVSSFLLFIPGLLMIISVTNEYSYKTHRQNIIDGWSRRQFILVKIVYAVLLALFSTLTVFLIAAIFGFVDGTNSLSFEGISYIGNYFVVSLSYIMVALVMAILLKRGGLAIGLYFLYATVLEEALVRLLNRFANETGRFLPIESADKLLSFPNVKKITQAVTGSAPPEPIFLLTIAYLIVYMVFAIWKFDSSDL